MKKLIKIPGYEWQILFDTDEIIEFSKIGNDLEIKYKNKPSEKINFETSRERNELYDQLNWLCQSSEGKEDWIHSSCLRTETKITNLFKELKLIKKKLNKLGKSV